MELNYLWQKVLGCVVAMFLFEAFKDRDGLWVRVSDPYKDGGEAKLASQIVQSQVALAKAAAVDDL